MGFIVWLTLEANLRQMFFVLITIHTRWRWCIVYQTTLKVESQKHWLYRLDFGLISINKQLASQFLKTTIKHR